MHRRDLLKFGVALPLIPLNPFTSFQEIDKTKDFEILALQVHPISWFDEMLSGKKPADEIFVAWDELMSDAKAAFGDKIVNRQDYCVYIVPMRKINAGLLLYGTKPLGLDKTFQLFVLNAKLGEPTLYPWTRNDIWFSSEQFPNYNREVGDG
jgi:hypothetical protein